MKNFVLLTLFFTSLIFLVRGQEEKIINKDIEFITTSKDTVSNLELTIKKQVKEELERPKNIFKRVDEYIEFIKGLVEDARIELKTNNNRRPSTRYSVDDILFTITDNLPKWIYPPSVWKESPVDRRRNIAQVIRTSSLISRPRIVKIRDDIADWSKESLELISDNYTSNTIYSLNSLLKSTQDFVTAATDAELMEPLFLTSGYAVLDDAVNHFFTQNEKEFNSALYSINYKFNRIANLAGDLRRSLESIREDATSRTKLVRHELFDKYIQFRLRHINHHIRSTLQTLSEELNKIPSTDKEASTLLRKHTADTLRTEIESLNEIKLTCQRTKAYFVNIWETALKEVTQSPLTFDYWIDTAAELKKAFVELGNSLVKLHHKSQTQHCNCGYYH